jgi:small conductance mechanosensitive channel
VRALLLQAPAAVAADSTRGFPAWLALDPERLGVVFVRLALTALAAFVAQRLLFLLVRRGEVWLERASRASGHGARRARTIGQLLRNGVTAVVGAWAVVHGLEILGWDVKPLLVGASILGAALGFGAQFLVRDVIAGAFIFIEDQFVVGDTIEVNGVAATVEEVTLRSTRLRDFQGRELHVANGEMKVVVNHSRGWNRAVVDLPVAPGQDLARALQAAEAVAADVNADRALSELMLEPFTVMGFEGATAQGTTLRLVARARPGGDSAQLARELRLRLLQRWREEGIRTAPEPGPVRAASVASPGPAAEP